MTKEATEKPRRPPCPEILATHATPARVAALRKASNAPEGVIRMAGGYGGKLEGGTRDNPNFITRDMADRLVAAGWLADGRYSNTYFVSQKGGEALTAWEEYLDARADYKAALRVWKAATAGKGKKK
jgi:hypothetical protein